MKIFSKGAWNTTITNWQPNRSIFRIIWPAQPITTLSRNYDALAFAFQFIIHTERMFRHILLFLRHTFTRAPSDKPTQYDPSLLSHFVENWGKISSFLLWKMESFTAEKPALNAIFIILTFRDAQCTWHFLFFLNLWFEEILLFLAIDARYEAQYWSLTWGIPPLDWSHWRCDTEDKRLI